VIVFPYTFQCKELLFVLVRMLPPMPISENGTIRQAAGQLANTLSRNVEIVDNHELLVTLDEPVEAVVIARDLGLPAKQCIASPLALELLAEPGSPAVGAWIWLRQQLAMTNPSTSVGIVRLTGLARQQLPLGIDQIPDGPGVLLWIHPPPIGVDQVFFIDRARTLGQQADVVIDRPGVSRVHAAIVPFQGTWAIEDRTLNDPFPAGTVVDNHPCRSRCLVPGMIIGLGNARLVVLSVR
jgi:hypothetical protein